MSKFYTGSMFLYPVSSFTSIAIDQINFISCQIFACIFGYVFNKYLNPTKINVRSRHLIEIFVGVAMLLFCFGSTTWYLLAQSIPVYLSIQLLSIKHARYAALLFSLGFLSIAHVARMYYDYGSYVLDITVPLMVQTQRLSCLAFNISDGNKLKQNIPLRKPSHKLHAVLRPVSILEFFSYLFNFHGVIAGPLVFYADYIRFIEGKEEEILENPDEIEYFMKNRDEILSAKNEMKKHFMALMLFFMSYLLLEPYFPTSILMSEYYEHSNIFIRYILVSFVMFFFRNKYYLAWTTCALTNLFAGIGFSGFKPSVSYQSYSSSQILSSESESRENKNKTFIPEYNIIKNFNFFEIELGTSTKSMTDNWNITTACWLRECVYDRMPVNLGMWTVFGCSAIWHGYYPGYYLAFTSVALITSAARTARRTIRPIIVEHYANWMSIYHVVTALISMFCLNFSILPFAFLDLGKGFHIWWSFYAIVPIISITIILFDKFKKKNKSLKPANQ